MSAFGLPVTDSTLRVLDRYKGKTITQEDRAREAMNLIHGEHKNMSALIHALNLKKEYGDGVSTLCLIYNATGDRVEVVTDQNKDWHGSVFKEEPPRSFENGQWIAFLHTKPDVWPVGSVGARVFRGHNIDGGVRDFMVAWCTRFGFGQNNAYTEIREKDHFPPHWDYIEDKLENSPKIVREESDYYLRSTVSIGGYTTSEFIAILKHKFDP